MRYQGKIVSWDDQRGFGFVIRHGDEVKIFVHISSFPVGSKRPAPGDVITYQLVPDGRGRSKAIDADYPGSRGAGNAASPARNRRAPKDARARHPLRFAPALLIAAGATWYWFGSDRQSGDASFTMRPKTGATRAPMPAESPSFRCETGKTHCSHMRSYEEALFYVRNCPNVSMDGDGDGEPCESQFGGRSAW